jgi:hypothetical protein
VQRFSPAGDFILTFGGGVNQTTGGNLCTEESGDVCRAGTLGVADGQFGVENKLGADGNYVAVGGNGSVYVADRDRIQRFDSDGVFEDAIPLPEPGTPGAMAIDPISGDLYFAFAQETVGGAESPQPNVYRLNPLTGDVLDELPVPKPMALATDAVGDVYAVLRTAKSNEIIEFDSTGAPVIPAGTEFRPPVTEFRNRVLSLATNTVTGDGGIDLMVGFEDRGVTSAINVYGPPPDKWPPPVLPPTIDAQFASTVGAESALVKAEINPRFWADTRYFVEYGTAPCSGGGCATQPDPPGNLLGAGVISASITTEGLELDQLQPGTTYFFRFVSQSSGGGPVAGEGEDQLEGRFTTRLPSAPNVGCPNQAFRTGLSSFLPDCRAYEMVSPVDKSDGDILVQTDINGHPARLDVAAESGGRFTYSTYRAFGDAQSSPYSSQYLATRGATGWATHGISPVQEGAPPAPNPILDTQFKAFSPELDQAWLTHSNQPLLDPRAVPGFQNLYRLDTETGAFRTLTRSKPAETPAGEYEVELQGLSESGDQALFRANGKLTANATSKGLSQIYEFDNGSLRLVSVRPNNTPSGEAASVGTTKDGGPGGRNANVFNAVSSDGSRVFWSESIPQEPETNLYVRIDGEETVFIAEGAEFVTANPEGSIAIVRSLEQELVEFDVDAGQATPIATSVINVVAFSEDASKIYFVSTDALADGADAGEPNLYLFEKGEPLTFIATLSSADISSQNSFGVGEVRPSRRSTQVTPDGGVMVFMSQANLTGYDSTDQGSGEAAAELYRYDAPNASLTCISCNPTGARPFGRELEAQGVPTGFWAAAKAPVWSTQLYLQRALSDDGRRAFFDSSDALVPRDTNGREDVYEWELVGLGDCTAQSAEFDRSSGGCISLISGGASPVNAEFLDANADGSEVFFTTGESLLSQDPGSVDVYVARVEGGFQPPAAPPVPCEGEGCQPSGSPAPPLPTSSNAFVGPPTPKPVRPRRCGPGKHRVGKGGKARCAPNKKQRPTGRGR